MDVKELFCDIIEKYIKEYFDNINLEIYIDTIESDLYEDEKLIFVRPVIQLEDDIKVSIINKYLKDIAKHINNTEDGFKVTFTLAEGLYSKISAREIELSFRINYEDWFVSQKNYNLTETLSSYDKRSLLEKYAMKFKIADVFHDVISKFININKVFVQWGTMEYKSDWVLSFFVEVNNEDSGNVITNQKLICNDFIETTNFDWCLLHNISNRNSTVMYTFYCGVPEHLLISTDYNLTEHKVLKFKEYIHGRIN